MPEFTREQATEMARLARDLTEANESRSPTSENATLAENDAMFELKWRLNQLWREVHGERRVKDAIGNPRSWMSHSPVADMRDFVRKYGTKGPALLVGAFIDQAPDFQDDDKFAALIGKMMGDLEIALEAHAD